VAEAPASAVPVREVAPEPGAFPSTVQGLPVMSVASTREVHLRNPLAHVVAVAGYLTLEDLRPTCADRWLGSFGDACAGRTVLADSPTRPPSSTGGGAVGALGALIHGS
jgi:hypothetical protein